MNIKEVIKSHGWTMEKLAEALGKKQPSISSIVNGNPKLSNLKEIADVMGISISELIADENAKTSITCPHCGKRYRIDYGQNKIKASKA